MVATKYTGVKYHDSKDGTRTYYIQYKHNGKVKRQKVGTKSEGISPIYCKKLRDETLVKLRLGDSAPIKSNRGSNSKTLQELSVEYFEGGGKKGEFKSKEKLKSLYNTHLAHLGNEPIQNIDNDKILILNKKKSKEISKKTKRVLSQQTVKNILTLLSAMLHYAKEKNYITSTPVIKRPKVDNRRERYLEVSEVNELLQELETSILVRKRERLILFVKLALTTGARLESILTIKGKDINRKKRSITLTNHKADRTYTGFFTPEILELIPELEPLERLFDVSDSKQIQRPLQRILNKLFNDGLNADNRKDRVVIHTLRHTFASHLAINDMPIHKIMKLMDHADIEMTLRYAKLSPDSGQEEVENLYG